MCNDFPAQCSLHKRTPARSILTVFHNIRSGAMHRHLRLRNDRGWRIRRRSSVNFLAISGGAEDGAIRGWPARRMGRCRHAADVQSGHWRQTLAHSLFPSCFTQAHERDGQLREIFTKYEERIFTRTM